MDSRVIRCLHQLLLTVLPLTALGVALVGVLIWRQHQWSLGALVFLVAGYGALTGAQIPGHWVWSPVDIGFDQRRLSVHVCDLAAKQLGATTLTFPYSSIVSIYVLSAQSVELRNETGKCRFYLTLGEARRLKRDWIEWKAGQSSRIDSLPVPHP